MQTLVVHAHPNVDSFNATIYRLSVQTLRELGHEVDTIDLYAEDFDPVMSLEERQAYLACPDWLVHRFADHIAKIQRAEHLVLVYPTWWWGPPAMLKGWLEKVWLPKITFEPAERKGERLKPKMTHVRQFTILTHGGAPWWWVKLIGDPHRKMMLRGMRMLFAKDCRTTWLQLHDMNNVTAADCERHLARVRKTLAKTAPHP